MMTTKRSLIQRAMSLILVAAALSQSAHGRIIYVDDDAMGANDGTSWQNAYVYLQDALAEARASEKPLEVRVAQGRYVPGESAGMFQEEGFETGILAEPPWDSQGDAYWTVTDSERHSGIYSATAGDIDDNQNSSLTVQVRCADGAISFWRKVSSEGGCDVLEFQINGRSKAQWSGEADWQEFSFTVPSGVQTFTWKYRKDGSSSKGRDSVWIDDIRFPRGTDREATFQLISGIALKGGYAGVGSLDPDDRDIGLYETVLDGDLAGDDGPAFSNYYENCYHVVTGSGTDETAVLDGFTVTGGNANGWHEYGGGLYSQDGSPSLMNCTLIANQAGRGGGAVSGAAFLHEERSHLTAENCRFLNNRAKSGGAISRGGYTLTRCLFADNQATGGDGGALFVQTWGDEVVLVNCTLTDNRAAGSGGAVFCLGDSSVTILNSILWNDEPSELEWEDARPSVTYSDIEGAWSGEGNIDADPLFVNAGSGNYHLTSQAGRWDAGGGSWIADASTSPCVDAGNPQGPVAYEPFPNGLFVNLGWHGGTSEASKSPSGLHAKYGDGTGELNDPHLIYTARQMNTIATEPNDWGDHFRLVDDLDLTGFDGRDGRPAFNVIASNAGLSFTGAFDGNAHTISHLTIQGEGYLGLFGHLGPKAEVSNLGVLHVDILGSGDCVGGVVGRNTGRVTRCFTTGTIAGCNDVGGVVGSNAGGHVDFCHAATSVTGYDNIGVLVGSNRGLVMHSYSLGSATGTRSIGGLIGDNAGGQVACCYSAGAVSGSNDVGGLVGHDPDETVTCSFWDTESSGQISSAGGVGLLTAQMHDLRNGAGDNWDWVDGIEDGASQIWTMPQEGGYPILAPLSGHQVPRLQGSGTPDRPYLVSDALELGAIAYHGSFHHYRLSASVDLSGIHWATAVVPWFAGMFNGDDRQISGLTIEGGGHLGLFGRLASGAEVKNLGVSDVNIAGTSGLVGGLVALNCGSVTDCYGTGAVAGHANVGGLVGSNGYWDMEGGMVRCCYSTGSVKGSERVGGLVGLNFGNDHSSSQDGQVIYCSSTATTTGDLRVGGLVGSNGGDGYLVRSYARGNVTGLESIGGLVGSNGGLPLPGGPCASIVECYATGVVLCASEYKVGGLIGNDQGVADVTSSFWDHEISGVIQMCGGEGGDACDNTNGLPTAQMQTAATFLNAGWDFVEETRNGTDDIWWILEGQDYPRLWWELEEAVSQ